MSSAGDWRSSAATDYFQTLDLEQLAFEFVSRDPQFREDRDRLSRGIDAGRIDPVEGMKILRKSWGLSFQSLRPLFAGSLGTAPAT